MQFSHDEVHDRPAAGGGQMPPDLHDTHHLWLKAILLAVWVVFSFGVCFFARDLQAWVQGWQLGYWMAAQGAVLMFMLIALVYCVVMDRFESRSASAPDATLPAARTTHAHPLRR
ncbi:DUF4212 domain-containing protein [Comamonas aquatica]|uniref:DUF4212 domain-containing protein n=1 Tax=Comamonas aquatica TaxID=225991 RepID=UPI001B384893|nr:DUF4212 domain-containing protein [Comamonas aquatica]QTX21500.1 DUF4212 domain-containing protein [Comamonas aquatica]